jgi:predicted O-methyltransferase YrrM
MLRMSNSLRSYLETSIRRANEHCRYRWLHWGARSVHGGRQFVPPGHFYSPIPALDDIRSNEHAIFGDVSQRIPGIDLQEEEQVRLLVDFKRYYDELPFGEKKTRNLRFFFANPAYSYSDAIFLYCMIRHVKPARVIEVGSGYSSCLMLDTNDLFFNGTIATTFIEPYPELLLSLITEEDRKRIEIISSRVQDVGLNEFDSLQANDILFIDSTHVSKVYSDVNRLFFEILPRINEGVYIHFHDIFYPFEYPKEWIYEGRAWNEAYLLRGFLQYNSSFRIVLMNTFLQRFYPAYFEEAMPLCLKNPGGSIWLRKENRHGAYLTDERRQINRIA